MKLEDQRRLGVDLESLVAQQNRYLAEGNVRAATMVAKRIGATEPLRRGTPLTRSQALKAIARKLVDAGIPAQTAAAHAQRTTTVPSAIRQT